ncbi:MAG: beta-ketoacyl-[acyl-carrier-protein] synthase family protein [Candidatus Omnitrophica bacterium]|nr:beta-ketoacyl-[acyl-carrier-protein] synthase family protein [Candidatus Omnitrophota bacterium]
MAERVVVTGLGVVSSLGSSLDDFWSNLIEGNSAISEVDSFDSSKLQKHYGGEVKNFSLPKLSSAKDISFLPRTHQFAITAANYALEDAGVKDSSAGVVLGTISSGEEFTEGHTNDKKQYPMYMATANLANSLGLAGSAYTVSYACASGNYALGLAYDRIKSKKEQIILAGAADFFSITNFIGFHRLFSIAPLRCQPFDKNRKGLIPAEGAGMLVLESLSSAKKRNAFIYGEIIGYGLSADATHPTIPSEKGILSCMRDALENARINVEDIDYINAHGTGTVKNDKAECRAIKKMFGKEKYKKIPVSSIKSMLGHAMGAASAIEAITCMLTLKDNVIPPTINYETPDPECDLDCVPNQARKKRVELILNNSFGFGGGNCSLVIARYQN